ncbi:MAG: prepilin-type N-terminal cleavage/methylation domain-containing protein [Sulfurimicrobium sp.]|nr:prepilin-type N-terminal cleavage/methylation domain-containing protein [Sulfurimicrobium sp.]
MKNQQGGFTLIEIAIVLVIIGLILGGVLKGQELITQAKIRNVANDFNGISAAYYSYQDRYRAMPGDDNGAKRWPAITSLPATAGNGAVEGKYNSATATDESRLFWQYLRLSGLITGAGTDTTQPQNAAGGMLGIQTSTTAAPILSLSGLVICSSNLPGKIANAIDSQFDDGNPEKGQVRAIKQTAGASNPDVAAAPTSGESTYTDDGSTLYILCKNM